jgi:hypothetical protein
MAVDSAKATPTKNIGVNLPLASGCRAIACTSPDVAMPIPMPAPMPVITAIPAPTPNNTFKSMMSSLNKESFYYS